MFSSDFISKEEVELNRRLCQAITDGDLPMVKSLLQKKADPHFLNEKNQTPLSLAISLANDNQNEARQNIVIALFKQPLTFNIGNVGVAILVTVQNKKIKETEILLKKTPSGMVKEILNSFFDMAENSALTIAIKNNDKEMQSLLTKYGANLSDEKIYRSPTPNAGENLVIGDAKLYSLYKKIKDLLAEGHIPSDDQVQALINRALQIKETLKSSAVAILFNLISKINPNGSEWNPLITALRDRAIAIVNDFNPKNIALVYNLITNRDDLNDPMWNPLIAALRDRALTIVNDFSPQSIALVYNLITNRDDVNDPMWNPLIAALRDRALAIVNDFSPQNIAMIHDLITYRDDANDPVWQPLLNAVCKRTFKQWEDTNVKIKQSLLQSSQNNKNKLIQTDFLQ